MHDSCGQLQAFAPSLHPVSQTKCIVALQLKKGLTNSIQVTDTCYIHPRLPCSLVTEKF